jgi:hypothetical protein
MPPRSLELECESDPCAIRAFGARSPQRARALSPRYSSKFELGHVATNLHRLELLAERCGECERICRCSLYFIGAATKVEYRQRDDEHGYMDQRTSQAALFRTSDGLTDDGEPLLRPARLEKSKRHSGQAVERRQRVVTALGELERSPRRRCVTQPRDAPTSTTRARRKCRLSNSACLRIKAACSPLRASFSSAKARVDSSKPKRRLSASTTARDLSTSDERRPMTSSLSIVSSLQTASAASSVQPPTKTASRRKAVARVR